MAARGRAGEMTPASGELPAERSASMSLATLAGVLVRSIPLIAMCAAGAFVVSLGIAFLEPREYTAHVSFIPQGHRVSGAAGGLAAQFGLGAVGGDPGQSPAFYIDLLGTREILHRVATAQYSSRDKRGVRQGSLAAIIGLDSPQATPAVDGAIDFLRKAVHSGLSQQTGVVSVNVTTREPSLSAQISARLLEAVDAFNRENARAQATQQRDFTQQRLNEFRDELRTAEANLQEYLQRNRDAATASEAAFQRERLAREVALRQQLYISVTQAFEQARMEEARDAPQITTIEHAEVPNRPDRRAFVQKGALGAILGGLLAVAIVLMRETFAQARRNDAAWYAEWEAARKRAPSTRQSSVFARKTPAGTSPGA